MSARAGHRAPRTGRPGYARDNADRLVVVVFGEDDRVAFAIGREQSQVVSLVVGSAPRIDGRDHRKCRSHRLELVVRILDRVDDQAGGAVGVPGLGALRGIPA